MTAIAPSHDAARIEAQELRNLRAEVERLRAALATATGREHRSGQQRHGPDPRVAFPMRGDRRLAFLRALVTRPAIEIGEYTYASDPDGAERFEERSVLFRSDDPRDRLVIGRYCSIAAGVRFLMNGAWHSDAGSTYPFWAFGQGWHERREPRFRGPITIGNDVWIGLEACILAGATIGDGAIVGARAVVSGTVRPYAVVAGNPAREIRRRYDDATIERLLALRWWDWPPERVTRNLSELVEGRFDEIT